MKVKILKDLTIMYNGHDGNVYKEGDEVELDDSQGVSAEGKLEQLLEIDAAELIEEKAEPKEKKVTKPKEKKVAEPAETKGK